MSEKDIFSQLVESWPSPIVARSRVGEFSGGLFSPGTLANADSRGDGPAGKINIGRKAAYPTTALVEWMRRKAAEA